MSDATKQPLRITTSQRLEGGRYSFSVQELSISSGSCSSSQAAFEAVFREIRAWAQSLTPDIRVLEGKPGQVPQPESESQQLPLLPLPLPPQQQPPQPSQPQKLEYVREVRPGAGAPILRRLIEKYGQKNNQELAEAIGFVGEHKVSGSTFSNALSGRGSRFVRCAIAMALGEQPSMLWQFLSLKVRIDDDEMYFGALKGRAAQQCLEHVNSY